MKKITVDHYGVHLSPNGLWFLLQEDAQNTRGLNVQNPFRVAPVRSQLSPTNIRFIDGGLSASADSLSRKLANDSVGKLLLPNPDNAGKVIFIEDNVSPSEIARALRLSSPTRMPIQYSWAATLTYLRNQAALTNVQPFVIMDVDPKWMAQNGQQVVSLFSIGTRALILVGRPDVVLPQSVKRIKNASIIRTLSKTNENLEQIGSQFLKDWTRNVRNS